MDSDTTPRFFTPAISRPALLAAAGRILVPGLWMGLIMGISFIETPLKFLGPGMTLALGLGIGQLVFAAMNIVEVIFFIVLAASCVKRGLDRAYLWVVASLGLVLLAKVALIRPFLSKRTESVLAGVESGGSSWHYFYIAADGLLTLLLITLMVMGVRRWVLPGR
ncbi:hypothetical protein ACIGB6_16825 [Paeniglutamicibacter gangotriensis]|uniref:Uncharacterized protein n=1 Tax=Paeniglutamicibacter gangotriensis Lz1y TaxID=1276920 RepID=M7N9W5_9MICC|nr:hypothetical protein [Paeniglutamicibacter gangotriensis]EMQ98584.1 hypothetical protein ADIAG_02012 [Paeniglutamicibacter gangotriensis Lz1y]